MIGPIECGLCKADGYEDTIIQVAITKKFHVTTRRGKLRMTARESWQEEMIESGFILRCSCGRCGSDILLYEEPAKTRKKKKRDRSKGLKLKATLIPVCEDCREKKNFVALYNAPFFVYTDGSELFMNKLIIDGDNLTNQAIQEVLGKFFLGKSAERVGLQCRRCGSAQVGFKAMDHEDDELSEASFHRHASY